MDKFEKLAQQIDDIGEVLCNPDVSALIEAANEEKTSLKRSGLMLKIAAACMRACPDAVKRLAIADSGKTEEEFAAMSEGETMNQMIATIRNIVVPFFRSSEPQEKKQ